MTFLLVTVFANGKTVFQVLLADPVYVPLCQRFHVFQLREPALSLSLLTRQVVASLKLSVCALLCLFRFLLVATWEGWRENTPSLQSNLLHRKTRILKRIRPRLWNTTLPYWCYLLATCKYLSSIFRAIKKGKSTYIDTVDVTFKLLNIAIAHFRK